MDFSFFLKTLSGTCTKQCRYFYSHDIMVCMILWYVWICYIFLLCMDILVDILLYYSIIYYYSFLSMTKGEKVLTFIWRNIYIYIKNTNKISGGDHIFRGRFRTSDICCHQSKRGRMLSHRFYEVFDFWQRNKGDRQNKDIMAIKRHKRATYGTLDYRLIIWYCNSDKLVKIYPQIIMHFKEINIYTTKL